MNRRWISAVAVLALIAPPCVPSSLAEEPQGAKLTLAEALRTALQNNLDLVIARKDPKIAALAVDSSRSIFDPVVGANASYEDTSSDTTQTTDDGVNPATTVSTTSGDQTKRLGADWKHLLNFGGSYEVSAGWADFSQDPQRFFNFGVPGTFESTQTNKRLNASFDMPLLRGFGKEVTTADVVLAKSGLEISRTDLKLQATLTLQRVENAYWDLVATRAALDVARQSLKLANDLLELNKKKVEVGTLAPIEITQAEAGVASREEGVIVAENAVEAAEDNLLRLLAAPKDSPMWASSILPTDAPEQAATTPSLDAAMSKAMETRPEIVTARQTVKDRELSERVAKAGLKHGLDLQANLAFGKNDNDQIVRIDGVPAPSRDTTKVDGGPDWIVGVVYSYPIGNRAAKASAATATLNREKAEVGLQSTEQDIRVDVRNAVRNVESGQKRVKAAESSTILQRKKLEAEQKKFDNGMSTSFEVLTFQTDLQNAQLSEIQARLDLVKAQADLERAQGTLLEARGLRMEE